MPDLTPTKPLSVSAALGDLERYKYHMGGIAQVSLNRLTDMLDGKVEVTEPSNPFTYLLETSSVNTAFAIQEFALLMRKRFLRLANTEEDLYLHMSDYDFLGRFSTPATGTVLFNILFNDFKTNAYYDPVTRDYVLKLPRHLKVSVGDYTFLLTSGIVIRLTANNVIDVKFEDQDFNNIFPISTNYINFVTKRVNENDTYLSFALKLPEVDVEVADIAIDPSGVVRKQLSYNKKRKFYYFRAFFFKDDKWNEMIVTHTNDVYDVNTPTCVIKVLSDSHRVEYHIPSVYINNNKVSTKMKFLIYTTSGEIAVDFADYQIGEFSTTYGNVFPDLELDQTTKPLQTVSKVIYLVDKVNGGKNGMSLPELKNAVIENSIGDRKLPITAKQLAFSSSQHSFTLIKHTDVVHGRVFKLETQIPSPLTRYPVTKFNLDILEYKASVSQLRQGNSVSHFGDHITVIPEGTVFKLEGVKLIHVSPTETLQLKEATGAVLTNIVNNATYLSVYYHYVLDTSSNKPEFRPYDLTQPKVDLVSFKQFNPSTRIGVNTVSGNLYKSPLGYTLDVLSNLKKYVNSINETNLTVYLVYKDVLGSKFFLQGNHHSSINGSPVFRFQIETNYHINKDDQIYLTNFFDSNQNNTVLNVGLTASFEILYTSNVIPITFTASDIDSYIHTSYLSDSLCGVTLEDIKCSFGTALPRLYAALHTSTSAYEYELHESDVVLRHTSTVYNTDNTIKHMPGDIVLDEEGLPVIQFHRGDVKLVDGNPVPINVLSKEHYLNMLMIDYRVLLTTSDTSKQHNKQIRSHITEVVTDNANSVQDELLDNSEAFVVIPKTIDHIKVKTPTMVTTIRSMQSFAFDVYVTEEIYNSADVRDTITYTIVKAVDDYLYSNTIVKKFEFSASLYESLKQFVTTIGIRKFTELDSEYIEVLDKGSRLSVDKTLVLETDGYNLKENVTVNFSLIE